jgi:hypothetical protein
MIADGVEADMSFHTAVTLEIRQREMVDGCEDRLSILISLSQDGSFTGHS